MELLRRKIDADLTEWKRNPDRLPLIVKGARQIGKTESIRKFAGENYQYVVEINFALQKQFRNIF
ncbi:MAG: ATP-binding protein, partial [Roseburia sp.]|nr:ATP-binding protein [Roseburia sp.]